MKKFFLTSFIILHNLALIGQSHQYVINIRIFDEQNEGIPAVSVVDVESGKGLITDSQGKFMWTFNNLPLVLKLNHLAYEQEFIRIRDVEEYQKEYENQSVSIILHPSELKIDEVRVTGSRFQIMQNEPYAFIDFLVDGKKIIALGYRNGNMNKREILVGDYNNLKAKLSLENAESLVEDFSDEKYVISNDSVYAIGYSDRSVFLENYCTVPVFKDKIAPIKAVFVGGFITMAQSETGQYQEYCYRSKINGEVKVFYQLGDIRKENQLESINKSIRKIVISEYNRSWISSSELRMMHEQMAKMRVKINTEYKPVHSYLIPSKNSFLIIDLQKGLINRFDSHANLQYQCAIEAKLNKEFTGRVHFDKSTHRCFLEYHRIQTTYLIEIDPYSGKTIKNIEISGHKHIDHLKVSDGRIFYLYQPDFGNVMKQLFSYSI